MNQEERKHLTRVRDALQRRLRVLQMQEAKLGNHTPPHIITEIEDIEQDLVTLKQQLNLSPEPIVEVTPSYQLPTQPITEEAQAIIEAARTWGTSLQTWLLKLRLLHPQDRLYTFFELAKNFEDKQAITFLFAALADSSDEKEVIAVVDEMLRRVVLTEQVSLKSKFMSLIQLDTLKKGSVTRRVVFFRDIIDIMNRNTFTEVNQITPAVIRVQDAIPETLETNYIQALLKQSDSYAIQGQPAARKVLLTLPERWLPIALDLLNNEELLWSNHRFYKEFLENYKPYWPNDRVNIFLDYLTFPRSKFIQKYQPDDE